MSSPIDPSESQAVTAPAPDRGEAAEVEAQSHEIPGWVRGIQLLVLLFVFLVGVRGLSTGFKGLGSEVLDSVFRATADPFIGLAVGILATTLVQSSSVTTSMIVALVAAPDNPLPIANAVPMIMGANIGTTVTNTVVSLGHVARPEEFKRAFAAATCHDFFNFIAVALLLPLELATGFLTKASAALAALVGSGGPGKFPNPIKAGVKGAMKPIEKGFAMLSDNPKVVAVGLLIFSALVIFTSLLLIVRLLRGAAGGRMKHAINRALGKSPLIGMVVGILVTVAVQSSSITTAVMVPLAAAGLVSLEQVFPIMLGANLGTTLTAILASMAAPEETAALAVQIAIVHLLFNLVGILIIYPIAAIRRIPLAAAEWLARVANENKRHALAYVLTLFYVVPALLIFISRSL